MVLPALGVIAVWGVLPAVVAAGSPASDVQVDRALRSSLGAVVCVDRYAAEIGAEILAEGGNAVDAAVAVGFALAVTHPAAGNIGGGGFLLVHSPGGVARAFDYRETAPAAATAEMFLGPDGEIDPEKAGIGHWVVGVPGTVAGLAEAHRQLGSLPWARLVQPARRLAEEGIEVDLDLAMGLEQHADLLRRYPGSARSFLHEDGTPYREGETWRQPELARVLGWIEADGAKAFYEGPVAELLDAEMRRAKALLTASDLKSYRVIVREPLRFAYRDHEVLSMPPPSSGGVALAQILGLVERLAPEADRLDVPATRHALAEAQRRAFADRARHLGDPEASEIDVQRLISSDHLDRMAATFDPQRATDSETLGPPLTVLEGSHTTHFSVVDAGQMAVANTYTLEESFGSKVVAEGTGFLLNNELHDFNLKPGLTDRKGRIGTDPNLARPGHRPLSSMTPTIVLEQDRPVLVTGSPGGRTIINTVACVLLRVLRCGQPLEEAVAAPRQHHQWFPQRLSLEAGSGPDLSQALEALGHRVVVLKSQGDAHSLGRMPDGSWQAVADRRLDGWAAAPTAVRAPPAGGR